VYPASPEEDSLKTSGKKPVRIYNTSRISEAPKIDGVLDDPCWQIGKWEGNYTQWTPNEGAKPTKPTEFKIFYDDKNIYAAIRVYDDPDKISKKLGRRDEFLGDMAGVNFDSYHDHRTGFEFDLTSAGQQVDIILTNPTNSDYDWNAVWYGKVSMEDSAWTAEFRIPLSQLRYSSAEEQVWGLHVWRWIDRLQEESDWEPQSSTGPGALYLFGELHGIKNLPASRRIEIMPYALGRIKTFQKDKNNPYADKGRSLFGNAGVDAKIGLSSNLTADLSINPDFGQVESDPSVMNLSAFETFYDEKRPFFLEGKNIFRFDFNDVNLFYSRRIGHTPEYRPELQDHEYMDYPENSSILSAAKISGKSQDGLAIGILHSFTSKEYAQTSLNGTKRDVIAEPLTSYFIGRVQKDFDEGNTILGGIVTSVNRFINDDHLRFLPENSYTGGIDIKHQWNDKEYYVDAKFAGSTINGSPEAITNLQASSARYFQRPDFGHTGIDSSATTLSGHGGSIEIGKGSKGLWRYSTAVNWRSPGLELNDIGYMQTADIITQQVSLSYFVVQPVSVFRSYSFSLNQNNNWDYRMNYLSSGYGFNLSMELLERIAFTYKITYKSEKLETRLLRGGPAAYTPGKWTHHFFLRSDPGKEYYLEVSSDIAMTGNDNSKYYYMYPYMSYRPVDQLKLSVGMEYSYNMDRLQYIGTYPVNNENKYLLAKINQHTLGFTFRIDYNFTPAISLQYYGSPFASTGEYSEFKKITEPRSGDYNKRFAILNPVLEGGTYNTGINGLDFSRPDFNFSQFRSNLVFRWEYLPGSQLYLVWSNDMTYSASPASDNAVKTLSMLKDIHPNNLFLMKFNYWFTI
jgi:hypothetical protein